MNENLLYDLLMQSIKDFNAMHEKETGIGYDLTEDGGDRDNATNECEDKDISWYEFETYFTVL